MFLCIFISSCKDEVEPIPAYIHIPRIEVMVLPDGTQGSNNQEIVDAWVYVGPELIGVFELPATVPILAAGTQDVLIVPGIKKNGLFQDRTAYPFLRPYSQERNLVPAVVDTIIPVLSYYESLKFAWLEDFEDNKLSLEKSGSTTTEDSMFIISDPAEVMDYDGSANKFSGYAPLDTGFSIFEFSSIERFDLPRGGQDIYLELNFKSNTEMVVGIYPINSLVVNGIPIVNLFSTETGSGELEWKKVYVSLKEDVNTQGFGGSQFRVFFNARSNTKAFTPEFYLDNIKLIHF